MTIDVAILLTDWDWSEKSRPQIKIDADKTVALFRVGGMSDRNTIEFSDSTPGDLAFQLDGLADLFSEAARQVRGATILGPEGDEK
jgi:hypothetical protein